MARASVGTRKPKLTDEQVRRREYYLKRKAKKAAEKQVAKKQPTAAAAAATIRLDEHYLRLAIQPLEIIEANQLSYHEGSALKYLLRWKEKGGLSDLLKARFYINRILELNGEDTQGFSITAPPVRRTQ